MKRRSLRKEGRREGKTRNLDDETEMIGVRKIIKSTELRGIDAVE